MPSLCPKLAVRGHKWLDGLMRGSHWLTPSGRLSQRVARLLPRRPPGFPSTFPFALGAGPPFGAPLVKLPPGVARFLTWAVGAAHAGWSSAGVWLVAASRHTGVPVVVLAAAALVLSWRAARRASRLAMEFFVALAVVVAAARLGWIRW